MNLWDILRTGYVPLQDPNAVPSWLRRDAPLPGPPPAMAIPGPSLSDTGMAAPPLFTPESGIPAPAVGQPPQQGLLDILSGIFSRGQAAAAPTPAAPANPFAEAPIPQGTGGGFGGLMERILSNVPPEMRQPMTPEQAGTPIKIPSAGDIGRAIAPTGSALGTWLGQGSAQAAVPGATPQADIFWPSQRPAAPNSQAPVRIGSGAPAPTGDPINTYLARMTKAESGGKMIPNQAGASSAFGPAQFTNGTWIDTVREADPQMWQAMGGDEKAILKLRENPQYHMKMADAFTRGNAAELAKIGVPVTDASLYTMHFFGRGDGPRVLSAAPNTPIEQVVSAASISANPHLKGMTVADAKNWAARTIGASGPGSDPWGTPGFVAPSLPSAPTMQALRGVDPAAFDKFSTERVMMAPPLSTGERVTNVLANMAAGARGAKTAADVLLGAGMGAGRGATENIAQERSELQRGAEKSSALNRFFAEVGVRKAGAVAEGQNFQVDAANKNATLQHQVATAQAKADADTKNALEEAKSKLDQAKWNAMQEQAVPVSGGMLIARKTADGRLEGVVQKFDDIYEQAKKIKAMSEVMPGGKDNDVVTAMRYAKLKEQRDDGQYRAAILEDFVERGWWVNALPKETVAQIDNEAKKGAPLDPSKPEYKAFVDKKRTGMLWQAWSQKPELEKLIVPFMARQGHIGARMLMTPNG